MLLHGISMMINVYDFTLPHIANVLYRYTYIFSCYYIPSYYSCYIQVILSIQCRVNCTCDYN